MTTITATGPATQTSTTVQATTSTPAPAPVTALPARPDAVVISIGKGTLSAAVHPLAKTAEQRVDSLVEEVRSHNAMADLLARTDWTIHARYFGAERAAATKAEFEKAIAGKAERIGRQFGENGIDVRTLTETQAAESGLAKHSVLVDSFSFEAGGSTYAVTPGGDGTLVGTRDGQAWKTWRITPPRIDADAAAALATLQTYLFGPKSGATSGSRNGIDRVA